MSSFNAMFNELQRLAEVREKQRKRDERQLEMGDTAAGRAIVTGKTREEVNMADPNRGTGHASWNIREFKQNSGARKGRRIRR